MIPYIEDRKIYTMYLERFGDRKPSELGLKEVYCCPKCEGKGIIHQHTSDGRGEYDYRCDVCEGVGYTGKKMRPKMVQVGWE